MDIQYSKSVTFRPTFKGNLELPADKQIVIELTPLAQDEFSIFATGVVQSNMHEVAEDDKSGVKKAVLSLEVASKFRDLYLQYGKAHVVSITGLRVNGADVNADTVATETPLLGLVVEIVNKLWEISNLTDEDEKN